MAQDSDVVAVPVASEKPMTDKEVNVSSPVPEKKVAEPVSVASEEKVVPEKEASVTEEAEKSAPVKEKEAVVEKVIALTPEEIEKKALDEFKELVREALNKHEFTVVAVETPNEEKKPAAEETKEEAKTEEAKTEEVKTEDVKTEEVKTEEAKTEKVKTEEAKPEDVKTEDVKTEKKPAAAAPVDTKSEATVPATVTTEKAEEDGTKTVEAIEESIVSVTPPESAAPVSVEETVAAVVETEAEPLEPEEVSIYGVPLLHDERSDVILLKFLRARDFKVKEALTMLKNTVQWRKDNKIDEIVEEEEEASEFEKMVFVHGVDKEGRVVIYSSYGEFQNKELFSDKEKLNKFLSWRIRLQEKCVRGLDFSSADANTKSSFVFVSDFRNAPGLGKRALWQFIRRAVKQFEDNYPEFSTRELFINVPWWYIPYYKTFGSIVTSPKTRSKMVLAGPSKSADTIFKYIAPEQVPVKYGGLSKDVTLTTVDTVTEAIVKPAATYTIELPASEACNVSWEVRVLGADVSYGAQFEPTTEGSYAVIVSKNRKIGLTDEPVITDSFKVGEPGKIVITIDNQTSKKKKVLYRSKTQAKTDL